MPPSKKRGSLKGRNLKKTEMPASSEDNNSITVANKAATNVAEKATSQVDPKADSKVDNSIDNKVVTNVASKVADEVADSVRTSVADSDHHSSSPLSTSPSTPPEKGQDLDLDLDLDQPQLEAPVLVQVVPDEINPQASEPIAIDPVGNSTNGALVLSNGLAKDKGKGLEVQSGISTGGLKAPDIIRPTESTPMNPPRKDRAHTQVNMNYDNTNLEEITMRQLGEDADAYEYDLNWCRAQLSGGDLTPQETRTLQLRTLDLTHQIRHCNHKIETMRFQARKSGSALPRLGAFNPYRAITNREANAPSASATAGNGVDKHRRSLAPDAIKDKPAVNFTKTPSDNVLKRPAPVDMSPASPSGSVGQSSKRAKVHVSLDPVEFDDDTNLEDIEGPILAMQRLGFWKCQLCTQPKYLLAKSRSPAMPCKWPLRDISKMIAHFTNMHTEHEDAERLGELGRAFELNRGPFEYWLRRTRNAKIDAPDNIDECIDQLKSGHMPTMLRRYSTVAAKMTQA